MARTGVRRMAYLLHVGGGYNFSELGGNGGVPSATNGRIYDARSIPGVFVGDPQTPGVTANGTPFMTNTGAIPATSFNLYHTELAGQYGSYHFQTEFLMTQLNTIGFGNQIMTGCYFQTGYFLTGESCGYNKQAGVLDYNVKPFSPSLVLAEGAAFAAGVHGKPPIVLTTPTCRSWWER